MVGPQHFRPLIPERWSWWVRLRLFFKRTIYSVDWMDDGTPYVVGWKKLGKTYYIVKEGTMDEVFGGRGK